MDVVLPNNLHDLGISRYTCTSTPEKNYLCNVNAVQSVALNTVHKHMTGTHNETNLFSMLI